MVGATLGIDDLNARCDEEYEVGPNLSIFNHITHTDVLCPWTLF